jgi:hypothetical protein
MNATCHLSPRYSRPVFRATPNIVTIVICTLHMKIRLPATASLSREYGRGKEVCGKERNGDVLLLETTSMGVECRISDCA